MRLKLPAPACFPADLPTAAAILQTTELGITVDETYDFEDQASTPQDLVAWSQVAVMQGLVFFRCDACNSFHHSYEAAIRIAARSEDRLEKPDGPARS